MRQYFDLHVRAPAALKYLKDVGYAGACVSREYKDLKHFEKTGEEIKGLDIRLAALVSTDFRKKAQSALDAADLIYAQPADEKALRQASECWEVDMICHSKSLKLDNVSAKMMAQRGIALEISILPILKSFGVSKSAVINTVKHNICLARKYKIPLIFSSGAEGEYGVRAPLDIIAFATVIGLPKQEAVKTVSDNPNMLLQKSSDRADSNILLDGLRVVSWGDINPVSPKRKWGWY